jgi:hypothetical protein
MVAGLPCKTQHLLRLYFARFANAGGAGMSSKRLLSFIAPAITLFLVTPQAYCVQATLAWDPNSEPDLDGYKVYYKTGSSGEPYDGTGATQGDSPIDVKPFALSCP